MFISPGNRGSCIFIFIIFLIFFLRAPPDDDGLSYVFSTASQDSDQYNSTVQSEESKGIMAHHGLTRIDG